MIAVPNGYDQLLLALAVARAGRVPAPVNDRCGPRDRPRGGRLGGVARDPTAGPTSTTPTRVRPGRGRRTQRESRPCSTRRAPPASRRGPSSPTGRWWPFTLGVAVPAGLRRDEPVAYLPWPTSWGSPGPGRGGCRGAVRFLPRSTRCGARRRSRSARRRCSSACRPCTACCSKPGADDRDLDRSGCGSPAPTPCPPTWPPASSGSGPPSSLPAGRRASARRCSPRATAWSRPAGGGRQVSPPW